MGQIQYNRNLFTTANQEATAAKSFMDSTLDSSSVVKGADIPEDFSAAAELSSSLTAIDETCEAGPDLVNVFDSWTQSMTDLEKTGVLDEATWGDYLCFDDSLLIYVDGQPFPIDQYVMGVLDGEHEAMKAYTQYYHGEISYNQMMEFLKAFAIIARSYGLAQTIYSDYNGGIHQRDHAIENGSSKQCFNTRLFTDKGDYSAWAGVASAAAQAVIETTGMVYACDGEAISTYFRSNMTAELLARAKEGMNYKEVLDWYYGTAMVKNYKGMADKTQGRAKLSYVDYSTEQILGEVPATDMVSSRASINLNGNARVNVPYITDDRSEATAYTGNHFKPEDANTYGSAFTSQPSTSSPSVDTSSPSSTVSTPSSSTTPATTTPTTSSTSIPSVTDETSKPITTGSTTTPTTPTTNDTDNTTTPIENDNNQSPTEGETNHSIGTPDTPQITKPSIPIKEVLSIKEFKKDIPQVSFVNTTNVDVVKDTTNSVSYNINNADTTSYNTLIKELDAQGYTIGKNGTWSNDETIVKILYDNEVGNMILEIIDKEE